MLMTSDVQALNQLKKKKCLQITVNGKNADFPLINDNLKTWRDVYFFGMDIAIGVSIKCTLDLSIVQVFINGYYYGQVHGLLGSMYQEPKFDLKLPNGEVNLTYDKKKINKEQTLNLYNFKFVSML